MRVAPAGSPDADSPNLRKSASRPGVEVFQAGTRLEDETLVTSGGRVLNVCASGSTLREALRAAYQAAADVHWEHQSFRSDIGRRVLESGSDADAAR